MLTTRRALDNSSAVTNEQGPLSQALLQALDVMPDHRPGWGSGTMPGPPRGRPAAGTDGPVPRLGSGSS